jgi:hypothetical protein
MSIFGFLLTLHAMVAGPGVPLLVRSRTTRSRAAWT